MLASEILFSPVALITTHLLKIFKFLTSFHTLYNQQPLGFSFWKVTHSKVKFLYSSAKYFLS